MELNKELLMITETNELVHVKNTFKENKFTRKAVLKKLLQSYIPSTAPTSNPLLRLGNLIAPQRNRYHVTLATAMLKYSIKKKLKKKTKR